MVIVGQLFVRGFYFESLIHDVYCLLLLTMLCHGYSDWLWARCMTILIGGALANQRGVWERRNTVCALVVYALRSILSSFLFLSEIVKFRFDRK